MHQFSLSELPPPINACRASVKGRLIDTEAYRNWKTWAHLTLMGARRRLPDNYFWRINILIPGRTGADLDAFNKQILDALGAAKITPDDKLLVDMRTRWHAGPNIEIIVKTEGFTQWAPLIKRSQSLMARLMKPSSWTLPL